MTNEERAIRDLIDIWLRASQEGDTATVLRLMADDVVFLTPGRPPFGKEEFAAVLGTLDAFRMEAVSDVRELRITGDWAYAWTDLSVTMTPTEGGAPMRRRGNTLSIFRRLPEGRWVLFRDANLLAAEDAKS